MNDMLGVVIGAVIGIFICSLCTSNKITDLYLENYYLLRRLEELQNEIANNVDGEKHDK